MSSCHVCICNKLPIQVNVDGDSVTTTSLQTILGTPSSASTSRRRKRDTYQTTGQFQRVTSGGTFRAVGTASLSTSRLKSILFFHNLNLNNHFHNIQALVNKRMRLWASVYPPLTHFIDGALSMETNISYSCFPGNKSTEYNDSIAKLGTRPIPKIKLSISG